MAPCLDPREILSHLNQLGYTHIEANQLKEFMKDLKKLMKYESKQLQNTKVPLLHDIVDLNKFAKVDSYIYSTSTIPSKFIDRKTKENIITVEVKTSRKNKCVATGEFEEKQKTVGSSTEKSGLDLNDNNVRNEASKLKRTKSAGQLPQSKVALRPKSSFIRPNIPLKKSKSDPVALYHKYQAEWKKIRFPGEDNRSQLRWMIREKMMGDEKV